MSQPSPLHGPIGTNPETDEYYREALISPQWDVGDGTAPRIKYVIFCLARTGSVLLSAHLRRRGIGVPLEYLGVNSIARRLGCLDKDGNTPLGPYFEQLYAKRTTPSGIFGIRVHPVHLRSFAQEDIAGAANFFAYFDRVLVLLRRDKLLQAISLVRMRLTQQSHLYPGDVERHLTEPDNVLFGSIVGELTDIVREERYLERVLALIDRRKVQRTWYEELSEPTIDRIATWLAGGAQHGGVSAPLYEHPLPRQGNAEEASALKRRFLAYVTGEVK